MFGCIFFVAIVTGVIVMILSLLKEIQPTPPDKFGCTGGSTIRGDTALVQCNYSIHELENVSVIQVFDLSDYWISQRPIEINVNSSQNSTVKVRKWTINWFVYDDIVLITWAKENTTCTDKLSITLKYLDHNNETVKNSTVALNIEDSLETLNTKVESAIAFKSGEVDYQIIGEGIGGCTGPTLSMFIEKDNFGKLEIPMDCTTVDKNSRDYSCSYTIDGNTFGSLDKISFSPSQEKPTKSQNVTIQPTLGKQDLPCRWSTACVLKETCHVWCKVLLKESDGNINIELKKDSMNDPIAVFQSSSNRFVVADNYKVMKIDGRRSKDIVHFSMTIEHTRCFDGGNYSLKFSNGKSVQMKVALKGLPQICKREEWFSFGDRIELNCGICATDKVSSIKVTKTFFNTTTYQYEYRTVVVSGSREINNKAEGIHIVVDKESNIAHVHLRRNAASISDDALYELNFTSPDNEESSHVLKHKINVTCSTYEECESFKPCDLHCKFPLTKQAKDVNISVIHRHKNADELLATLSLSNPMVSRNDNRKILYLANTDDGGIYFHMTMYDTRCTDAGPYTVNMSNGASVQFYLNVTGLSSNCKSENTFTFRKELERTCFFCVPDHVQSFTVTKLFYNKTYQFDLRANSSYQLKGDGMNITIQRNMLKVEQLQYTTSCTDDDTFILRLECKENKSLEFNFTNRISVPGNFIRNTFTIDSRGYTNRRNNASLIYKADLGCKPSDISIKMNSSNQRNQTYKEIKIIPERKQNRFFNDRLGNHNNVAISLDTQDDTRLHWKISFPLVTFDLNDTVFKASINFQSEYGKELRMSSSQTIYVIPETTVDVCDNNDKQNETFCNQPHPYYNSMFLSCGKNRTNVDVQPCPVGTKFALKTDDDCEGHCTNL